MGICYVKRNTTQFSLSAECTLDWLQVKLSASTAITVECSCRLSVSVPLTVPAAGCGLLLPKWYLTAKIMFLSHHSSHSCQNWQSLIISIFNVSSSERADLLLLFNTPGWLYYFFLCWYTCTWTVWKSNSIHFLTQNHIFNLTAVILQQ